MGLGGLWLTLRLAPVLPREGTAGSPGHPWQAYSKFLKVALVAPQAEDLVAG